MSKLNALLGSTLLSTLLLGWPGTASAAIYRCTEANGKVYFSDSGCPSPTDRHGRKTRTPLEEAAVPAVAAPERQPPISAAATPPTPAQEFPEAQGNQPELRGWLVTPPHRIQRSEIRLILSVVFILASTVWALRIAFRESTLTGLAMLFGKGSPFGPFSTKLMGPALLFLAGFAVALAPEHPILEASLKQNFITPCDTQARPEGTDGHFKPFDENSGICALTSLEYDEQLRARTKLADADRKYSRTLEWKWCNAPLPKGEAQCDALGERRESIDLTEVGPHTLVRRYAGPYLREGSYVLQLFVDGNLASQLDFNIVRQ